VGVYSISDLEQLSGIKAHTIRMWEQRYGLLRPVRTPTNIRLYSDDDLRRLLNVTTLCGQGRRISQVAALSDEQMARDVLACCDDAHDYNRQVNALLAAMLGLDEPALNHLFDEATRQLGFEQMMLHVAYPLLQRIGLMWLAGTMNIAQEHLLSHLLRQKLLTATDALPPVRRQAGRGWVLFLPEHELHELALLFMNYALRARGQHTLYLGQNMPIKELETVCATYRPDALVTVLTTQPERARVAEFAQALHAMCPQQVVLYGALARQEGLQLPPNCVSPALMTDFLALVEKAESALAGQ
jgi:DNA-binding transcriptional MerR regulator